MLFEFYISTFFLEIIDWLCLYRHAYKGFWIGGFFSEKKSSSCFILKFVPELKFFNTNQLTLVAYQIILLTSESNIFFKIRNQKDFNFLRNYIFQTNKERETERQ